MREENNAHSSYSTTNDRFCCTFLASMLTEMYMRKDNIIPIASCDPMTTICDKTYLDDANTKQFISATPTP